MSSAATPPTSAPTTHTTRAAERSSTTAETTTTLLTTEPSTTTVSLTSPADTTVSKTTATGAGNVLDQIDIITIGCGSAGALVVVLIIIFLICFIRRKRKREKKPPPTLPHPSTLDMLPYEANGGTTADSTTGLVCAADPPATVYEDPDTGAPIPVIKDKEKRQKKVPLTPLKPPDAKSSVSSGQYVNLPSRTLTESQVSDDCSSFGVYVVPVERKPPDSLPPCPGDQVEEDTTYIPMNGVSFTLKRDEVPTSPTTPPTHPDDLYMEGRREEMYTVPHSPGLPPPLPCGDSKIRGYVNLPSPGSGPNSLEEPPFSPTGDYQNVRKSPYLNHRPDVQAEMSPKSAQKLMIPPQGSASVGGGNKVALSPPNGKKNAPPKTTPKPKSETAPARQMASAQSFSDRAHSPEHKAAKAPKTLPKSSSKTPIASPPSDASSDSEGEEYENAPDKRDYQNVPNKKADPNSRHGQTNEHTATEAAPVSPKKYQPRHFPGAVTDELKKKINKHK